MNRNNMKRGQSKSNFKLKKTLRAWGIFGSGGAGGSGSSGTNGAPSGGNPVAATPTGNSSGGGANFGAPNAQQTPGQAPTFEQNLDAIAQTFSAPEAARKAALEANGGKAPGSNSPFAHITDDSLRAAASNAKVSGEFATELNTLFDGNSEKATMFGSMLDKVFQAGIIMSTRTAMKIGDTSIEHLRDQVQGSMLPEYMKDFQIKQAVSAANPMLNHPAYKPVYDVMVAGLSAQYPNASMQDIQAKAQEQLKTLAEGITKGSNPNPNNQTTQNGGNSGMSTDVFDDDFFK